MERLKGKVVLITGAAGGIGQATARTFVKEGASLLLTDLIEDDLSELASELSEIGGKVVTKTLDVTSESDWINGIGLAVEEFGALNIVINNAGRPPSANTLEEMSLSTWRSVMSINLDGVFLGVKHGIKEIKRHGPGAIVNLSSIMGLVALPRQVEYGASKGGVTLLTRGAAVECLELGYDIRVNSVHPGFVHTNMVKSALAARLDGAVDSAARAEEMIGALASQQPAGRLATPQEVANAILFLSSDESSYINGAQITVDGGYTAR